MKRAAGINALLNKATTDYDQLKKAYDLSLHEKQVRDDLKVLIKNIFENLRSCLDYVAQDTFDTFCKGKNKPDRLYFPIRPTITEFEQVMERNYPGLISASKTVYALFESIQPYRDPWLEQINKLNNHNKHQDLVQQTRDEAKRVTVSHNGGSVSWGPGVTFGSGVSIMGVPIDPRTQMPVPNTIAKTEVVIWVDFRFQEINQPVLPFIEASIQRVNKIFHDLEPYI